MWVGKRKQALFMARFMAKASITKSRLIREKHTNNLTLMQHRSLQRSRVKNTDKPAYARQVYAMLDEERTIVGNIN